MNVLLVIEGTYPWYRGGVSEWIYRYIEACKDFNFSILQIATDPFFDLNPDDALYPFPENISEFNRIPPPDLIDNWESSLDTWFKKSNSKFASIVKNKDIIHVTNTGFAGWLGVEILKLKKLPLVLTEHAIYWLEVLKGAVALECGYKIPENFNSKNQVVSLFKGIARNVYTKASQIITVSECNISLQEQLGATNITYIPNGIPISWISSSSKIRAHPVLGWVGRCAEMKNPIQFFDYVEEFQKQGFDAEFLMLLSDAGEHLLEEKVRIRASKFNSVNLIWNQSSKEYYKNMNILLITSHNESQPLVMFEALSNMVLPVGREVGDLTNKYGFTFPKVSSISQICSNVIQFWSDPKIFIEYLQERHTLVKENHTWCNIFNKYESVMIKTVQDFESVSE